MTIKLKVKTNNSKNEIVKINNSYWEIKITKSPENNKANEAIVSMIAKDLGIAKSRVLITSGLKRNNKTIEII